MIFLIGSIVDINRSLSDDMFDNVVAQIADDGGFNYDEFSQGKPVVRMSTSKGILSQVQDDYYDSSTPTGGNLNKRDRHVVENGGNAISQCRSNSMERCDLGEGQRQPRPALRWEGGPPTTRQGVSAPADCYALN